MQKIITNIFVPPPLLGLKNFMEIAGQPRMER